MKKTDDIIFSCLYKTMNNNCRCVTLDELFPECFGIMHGQDREAVMMMLSLMQDAMKGTEALYDEHEQMYRQRAMAYVQNGQIKFANGLEDCMAIRTGKWQGCRPIMELYRPALEPGHYGLAACIYRQDGKKIFMERPHTRQPYTMDQMVALAELLEPAAQDEERVPNPTLRLDDVRIIEGYRQKIEHIRLTRAQWQLLAGKYIVVLSDDRRVLWVGTEDVYNVTRRNKVQLITLQPVL